MNITTSQQISNNIHFQHIPQHQLPGKKTQPKSIQSVTKEHSISPPKKQNTVVAHNCAPNFREHSLHNTAKRASQSSDLFTIIIS
jgi:hypothetical protein